MIRLLLAVSVSFVFALLATKALIDLLIRYEIGQTIREDGPEGHHTKAGTPTMGGVAIVAGAVAGYIVSNFLSGVIRDQDAFVYTRSGLFVMLAIVGGGAVGLMDDWIGVVRERNLGLNKRAKLIGLVTVAATFAVLMVRFTSVHTELSATRFDSIGLDLGDVGWVIWAVLLVLATSNAVNLTDGLDGLAAGSAIFSFAAFTFVAFWAFRHEEYSIPHALDLATVATAMLGACAGFLWFNAAPAQIFMGDTGSLAIGTGLAALGLALNTHLLLPVLGGLFVLETVSVIVQVATFRLFGGRRVFRMAPIHHHFELGGWPETTVIIRLWMIHGLFVGVGLGLYYADAIYNLDLVVA